MTDLAKLSFPDVQALLTDLPKNDRGKVDQKSLKARQG
jgi:hypothetical protein